MISVFIIIVFSIRLWVIWVLCSKYDEGVLINILVVQDYSYIKNVELDSITEHNFLLVVVSTSIQVVVLSIKIPIDLEQDLSVASDLVLPSK